MAIDEARRHVGIGRVDGELALGFEAIRDFDDDAVVYPDIAAARRRAGAVDDLPPSYEYVPHRRPFAIVGRPLVSGRRRGHHR